VTGKIVAVTKLQGNGSFELAVSLIDPEYFENEKRYGVGITVQEASRILAEGVIVRIV
jgi:hypothetical protein